MVKKEHIHVIGASVVALIALVAIVAIVALWYTFGYGYVVVPLSKATIEAATTSI